VSAVVAAGAGKAVGEDAALQIFLERFAHVGLGAVVVALALKYCCGPVTASSEELARLPVKSEAEHDAALAEYNCVHLGPNGCEVYDQRPLICRLFGTTPRLPCPHGRGPELPIEPAVERQVHRLIATTRQRLV